MLRYLRWQQSERKRETGLVTEVERVSFNDISFGLNGGSKPRDGRIALRLRLRHNTTAFWIEDCQPNRSGCRLSVINSHQPR